MSNLLATNLDLFIHEDFFSKALIDNIPGVFYVYKECDEVYRMFACNQLHLTVTGYSAEEAYNQEPFFFIDDASKQSIAEGLAKIKFQNYVNQVYGSFLTKNGELAPYVFEGYGFQFNNENYFMGVGTDISDLTRAHQDLKNEQLQRALKEKELLALTLRDKQKEEILASISKKLDLILAKAKDEEVAASVLKLSKDINSSFLFSEDNWQKFELLFKNLHEGFYEQLVETHPDLTKSEQHYCALVKLHMNSEQICNTLNISKEGLKKKKYRLKQKLILSRKQSLENYISKF